MSKPEPQRHSKPPPFAPESGWKEVTLPFNVGSGRTLFTGLEGGERMRLRLYLRTSDNHLVGRLWCGPGTEGPPGFVHGGACAYILDEAMGAVGWANDYPVVAATLEFAYKNLTPLLVDLEIEAWIESVTPHRLNVAAELRVPGGSACVTSRGSFAILSREKTKAFHEFPDPLNLMKSAKLKWAED